MNGERPVFVKVDKYESVVSAVEVIRKKISEAKATLSKISDIKSTEDSELSKWDSELSDVENKVNIIESILSEGS